jgi:hypothetical protein
MSDYRTLPLKICAFATGGADVDVSATLFVDDSTTQEGDTTLTNVHQARQCATVRARQTDGEVKLRILLAVVPLAGNGDFAVQIELDHPNIPGTPRHFSIVGTVPDGVPKPIRRTYKLP